MERPHRHRFEAVPGWLDPNADDTPLATPTPDERARFSFLRSVPILRTVDEEVLWRLSATGIDQYYRAGEIAVHEGDDAASKRFYIVREGAADVVVSTEDGAGDVVAGLAEGDFFGELGLLTESPRNATIRAARGGMLATSFDPMTFQAVIAEHVMIFRLVRAQRARGITHGDGPIRVTELGLFSDMPLRDIAAVLRDAEQQHVPPSAPIVTQGEAGDRFYVVLDGEVQVERDGEVVAELGPGDFFGETALLFDCPRTATVRATKPTMVWSLARPAFERVVRHTLTEDSRLQDTVARRLARDAS